MAKDSTKPQAPQQASESPKTDPAEKNELCVEELAQVSGGTSFAVLLSSSNGK